MDPLKINTVVSPVTEAESSVLVAPFPPPKMFPDVGSFDVPMVPPKTATHVSPTIVPAETFHNLGSS